MAGYLIKDIEEYEQLYKATKDRHLKDWYRFKIRLILEKIIKLFRAVRI